MPFQFAIHRISGAFGCDAITFKAAAVVVRADVAAYWLAAGPGTPVYDLAAVLAGARGNLSHGR